MSKKSQRKNSLKSSILVLLLMAILLIVATYAWFTANLNVRVDTLDVKVEASNGLQIATNPTADDSGWKTIIGNRDIDTNAINTAVNYLPGTSDTFSPISTNGAYDSDGHLKFYKGVLSNNVTTGAAELVASDVTATADTKYKADGNCLAFDLYFKVDQANTLKLMPTSKVVKTDASTSDGIQNAVRVAFVPMQATAASWGTGSSYNATTESQVKPTAGTTNIIWEPNNDVHTDKGVANAALYSQTTTTTGGSQLSYAGLKAAITSPINPYATNSTYMDAMTMKVSTPTGWSDGNKTLFDLQAGVTKYRIYVWFEGQDVDCENYASGGDVNVDLAFTIQP